MFQPKTEHPDGDVYTGDRRQIYRQNVKGICGLLAGKPLGEVINMSGNGMLMVWRERLPLKEGNTVDMQLRWQEMTADIRATITWTKLIAFRRWLIGLNFKGLTSSDVDTVKKMAITGARFEESSSPPIPKPSHSGSNQELNDL